jgi:DNA-binding MarR family transcriptional regulator
MLYYTVQQAVRMLRKLVDQPYKEYEIQEEDALSLIVDRTGIAREKIQQERTHQEQEHHLLCGGESGRLH